MEKKRILSHVLVLIIVFVLGFMTSRFNIIPTGRVIDIENSGNQYKNSQNSLMDNSEKRILINRIIHNNYVERIPTDYLDNDDILVYDDKIILKINNAKISNYESESMLPFLAEGANGIVVKPETENEINVGDIITFRRNDKFIVHRVIEKGIDDGGVYFITKGDNSGFIDEKIRFEEIEHKLVGVIY